MLSPSFKVELTHLLSPFHFTNLLVLDILIEFYICGFCFYSCKRRAGFFTFTKLLTSYRRASIRATFDLTELYLKVICYLTVSSGLAMKSQDKSSMNLYSIFWMKSSFAVPSLFMINTAKKEWGSLMHEFIIFNNILV